MEAQQSGGMADLAARLTKRLADANSNSNLVFSPLSIYAVLALLAAGAGGATLEEVLRVLGARSRRELEDSVARLRDGPLRDTSESGGTSVAFAYGVWSDLTRPMKPAYRDAVVGTYRAEASVVDFLNDPEHATGQINAWAAGATRNLITSVIPPRSLNPDTKLVLANAVYFKGKWDLPFYESNTENMPFYRLDGTAINVPFMTNYSRHYIAEHDGFKVLKLRYRSSSCPSPLHHSMCIFLPDARDGLGSLLEKITSPAGFLREHLPQRTVKVGQFRVPKFELSFWSSVTSVLIDLGTRLHFSPEADLSEMLQDDGSNLPLLVRDVFQQAVIEVNEEGTRAAAVTYSATSPSYGGPDPSPRVDFVADHPFAYFIIEEESHAVIFAGHVVDPSDGVGVVIPSPAPFQVYTTTKRNCDEAATDVYGSSLPEYNPVSPAYSTVSPVYRPTSPAYSPVSPVYDPSFLYSPVPPRYQYHPSLPKNSPASPAYNPSPPSYSPRSPVYRPTSPAYYRPTSPAYTPVSPERVSPRSPVYRATSPPYAPVCPNRESPTPAARDAENEQQRQPAQGHSTRSYDGRR